MSTARSQRLQILLRALALLVATGLLLFIGGRHRWRHDFSRGARHSLSVETVRVLSTLPEAPAISLFIPDREPERGRVAALLGACRAHRPGLAWEIVDPGREPARALTEGVQEPGAIIIEMGDARERFDLERTEAGEFVLSELDLTRGFLALARGGGALVRVVQGPGIPPLEGRGSYSAMRAILTSEGHRVEGWWPLRQDGARVPGDTEVLILPGPHLRLPPALLAGLEKHLAAGGGLFLMLDPAAEMADSSVDAGLGDLLQARGIRPGDGFVVDLGEENINLGKGFEVPVVSRYAPHPATRRLTQRPAPTCFPLARALDPVEGHPLPPRGLLLTDPRSFEERGVFDGNAHLDEDVDRKGPFVLAAASDSSAGGGGPLLVVGDSHFASNGQIDWYGNAQLLLGGVAWLGREGLRPELGLPPPPARLLPITREGRRIYALLSLVILPLVVLLVWPLRVLLSRRRRAVTEAANGRTP